MTKKKRITKKEKERIEKEKEQTELKQMVDKYVADHLANDDLVKFQYHRANNLREAYVLGIKMGVELCKGVLVKFGKIKK